MVIPIEHNKPSIPASPPNPFVLKGGDLWGMGREDSMAAANGDGLAFNPNFLW
jgi:hypothetical protein